MKASTEYQVGDRVAMGETTLLKRKAAQPNGLPNQTTMEIWTDDADHEYQPTLRFTLGLGEPDFYRLQ